MSWLEWILSIYDPVIFSLVLVALIIFVVMVWKAGFSFNRFTGEVENGDLCGGSSDNCGNRDFNLIYFALLIVVLIGVAYLACKYFLADFAVPMVQPVQYQREAVPHHSGASGAGEIQHSKVLLQYKPQGSNSKSAQSGKSK